MIDNTGGPRIATVLVTEMYPSRFHKSLLENRRCGIKFVLENLSRKTFLFRVVLHEIAILIGF